MKTFRLAAMVLLALFASVALVSCEIDKKGGNDDPAPNGGSDNKGKLLTKIIGTEPSGLEGESYTFVYDEKGRVIECVEAYTYEGGTDVTNYNFIWGDDAVMVTSDDSRMNYTLNLENGLVQSCSDGSTFSYNKSGRFAQGKDEWCTISTIWDGDKLASISEDGNLDRTFTYQSTCKKGYFPFIPMMIDFNCYMLFMAHPEIAGMRTSQLPKTIVSKSQYEDETMTLDYEFDKDGYISKLKLLEFNVTYTLTWK